MHILSVHIDSPIKMIKRKINISSPHEYITKEQLELFSV
jgi:hypothetical protein